MKKVLFLLFVSSVLNIGCEKDNLAKQDDENPISNEERYPREIKFTTTGEVKSLEIYSLTYNKSIYKNDNPTITNKSTIDGKIYYTIVSTVNISKTENLRLLIPMFLSRSMINLSIDNLKFEGMKWDYQNQVDYLDFYYK